MAAQPRWGDRNNISFFNSGREGWGFRSGMHVDGPGPRWFCAQMISDGSLMVPRISMHHHDHLVFRVAMILDSLRLPKVPLQFS